MKNEEMLLIVGGAGISGTLINAFSRLVTTLLSIGQVIGSAIRRLQTKTTC